METGTAAKTYALSCDFCWQDWNSTKVWLTKTQIGLLFLSKCTPTWLLMNGLNGPHLRLIMAHSFFMYSRCVSTVAPQAPGTLGYITGSGSGDDSIVVFDPIYHFWRAENHWRWVCVTMDRTSESWSIMKVCCLLWSIWKTCALKPSKTWSKDNEEKAAHAFTIKQTYVCFVFGEVTILSSSKHFFQAQDLGPTSCKSQSLRHDVKSRFSCN